MNGEQESKKPTIDEKRNKIQELLKKYPEKVGIGILRPINEVNQFLTMSINEQKQMNAEECGEASVVLNREATYVQLQINVMQAELNWCHEYIEYLICKKVAKYGDKYTPFEYRRRMAIIDNDIASKLQEVITQIQLRLKSLEYMPNQLRAMAASFSDLQQTKRLQR